MGEERGIGGGVAERQGAEQIDILGLGEEYAPAGGGVLDESLQWV